MSRFTGGWAPYVSAAARRRKAEREMARLGKAGKMVSPVTIEGRQIASTFWGKAWCDNLETYRDHENRLARGRTYVRNGSVLDLQFKPREVAALVGGSEIYTVKISIADMAKDRWLALCADCAGGIDSLVELLQGRFSTGVMERICRQDTGLFPRPSEIRFTCSCPDYASMCKHVAAVLYGVGARLDQSPELLFRLRAVDETALLSDLGTALPDTRGVDTRKTLQADDDLAALFDLDLADDPAPASAAPATAASKATTTKAARGAKTSRVKQRQTPKAAAGTGMKAAKPARPSQTAAIKTTAKKTTAKKTAIVPETGQAGIPRRAAHRKTRPGT